jgi:hypothetical protein
MKHITAIAHFVAVTLITTGCALAQDHVVKATVPFDFAVNGSSLPAGTYSIGYDVTDAKILSIRNWQQHVSILALGQTDSNGSAEAGSLVFHKCGEQYFLREIRYPNSGTKVLFLASKREKRAREHIQMASLPANSDVLIALNE